MPCPTCHQPDTFQLAVEAIYLFREYRDVHGLDEKEAATKAAIEIVDGYQLTEKEMQA